MKKKRWGKKHIDKRNWSTANEKYVLRGIFYLDFDWVQNWDKELEEMNKGKKGARFQFPKSLIELQAVWLQKFSCRNVEGITRKVVEFSKIPSYNDYSTIHRRVSKLDCEIQLSDKKEIYVSSDGSGMKMSMEGEYLREKHGKEKRNAYIKVVISSDPVDRDVLKVEASVEGAGKSEPDVADKHLRELIEKDGKKVKMFFGDGGLDKHKLFDTCDQFSIDTAIKIRKDAVVDLENGSWKRNIEVARYQKLGYKKWAKEKNYGLRWVGTEGIFSSVKVLFGEKLRSKKAISKCLEAERRFWAYQKIKRYSEEKISLKK